MYDLRVCDAMVYGLVVQEIEHVLDGEGQRTPSMRRTKDCLKKVIHKFLKGTLQKSIILSV